MKELDKLTAELLKASGHDSTIEALEDLVRLQKLSEARSAVLKVVPPKHSTENGNDLEIYGDRFIILRCSRVIDSNRALQIAEATGLPVVMIHDLEGIDASLVKLDPIGE